MSIRTVMRGKEMWSEILGDDLVVIAQLTLEMRDRLLRAGMTEQVVVLKEGI